jgi:TusA-related sulfurtransferase
MYTFYTDKQEVFECKLDLQGAKLTDSKARLVLESNNYNLLFYGQIDENGKCQIPVKKLKNLLSEIDSGKVRLEVIAEDTYFEPWSDSYNVKTNKKVTVEIVNKNSDIKVSDKKITVTEVATKKVDNKLAEQFLKVLAKKNITLANIKENKSTLQTLGNIFTKKYKLTEVEKNSIVNEVINKLK